VQLKQTGMHIRTASNKKNIITRFFDMTWITLEARPHKSIVIIDLYSGKRALIYAQWVGYICRIRKVSYCVVLHGGNLPETLRNKAEKINKLLLGAKRIIAPSEYLATEFNQFSNIQTIPNAIDVNKYQYIPKTKIQPRILFLRTFHKLTRPQDAIYCLNDLLPFFPDIHMTMAGGDEDGTLAECKEIISNLHLNDHIVITGKLSKQLIYNLSLHHDIFLHTMQIDNMPITILEAMALGLCIVATNVGGVPYILEQDKTAQLVNPGDIPSMVNAVNRYLLEPEYAYRIQKNARAEVQKYSWNLILPLWLNMFEELSL
jgi:glycosyltransferase involved in cell wall biosynthesis